MAYRYRNKTKTELTIVSVGVIKAGGIIETDEVIESPYLALVDTAKAPKQEKKETVNKDKGDVE